MSQKENNRRHYERNRSKVLSRSRAWVKANPEKQKQITRRSNAKRRAYILDWHLRKNYGITMAQREALEKAQGGKCAICKRGFQTTPCVDHCHDTGKVRGLLCYRCNVWMGAVDHPGWLEAAEIYKNPV